MLAPKRIKHRKQHRGRMRGLAKGHTDIQSGDYAIVAMEPGWITNRQIEAARVAITRHIRRGGKVWITIFPDKPVTKKPAASTRATAAPKAEPAATQPEAAAPAAEPEAVPDAASEPEATTPEAVEVAQPVAAPDAPEATVETPEAPGTPDETPAVPDGGDA